MDNTDKIKEQVRIKFSEYLCEHKHRKTPERFAILDYIYTTKGHFDVDSLLQSMLDHNFRVSRATIYNTIELLLDCNLIIKHQFGANISQFERTFGYENHDHIICTSCGKVKESKNLDIFTLAQQKKIRGFSVNYYSMYIYGICNKCKKERQISDRKNNPSSIKNNGKKK